MNIFPPTLSDFYKVSHRNQYPADTECIYSNLTPRSSRLEGVNKVVFFGLQYFLKKYLVEEFNKNFFWLSPTEFSKQLGAYKRRLDTSLGGDNCVDHWVDLYDLGYLPLEIKALPEGSLVPLRVPVLTVKNTHNEFFWLGQWMETLLSNIIWHPITTATIAYQYKELLDKYANETSDIPEFVTFQGHDFSMRGHSSLASSYAGGAGHLLSFAGTDTIPAIDFLEQYYSANAEKEIVGTSVAATEHSVMTVEGEAGEFETFRRLITEVHPTGIVSIVSDTYNIWRVLTDYLPRLRDVILQRDGKVVIRPDSGDPVDIICGRHSSDSPADDGVIKLLYKEFGGTTNSKGFIQLNPKVGAIYGDSITLDRCKAICEGLRRNGFASTNMVFGIGSYTYQYLTRDTFGLAFKGTAIRRSGEWFPMFKNPVTDSGMKRSAKGLLAVIPDVYTGEYTLHENVSEEVERSSWNCLRTVFSDGKLVSTTTLSQMRQRLQKEKTCYSS